MHTYQQFVKSAQAHYFSALISQNHHCLRVLFRTINTVLNTVDSAAFDNSEKPANVSQFFVDKISSTRANISISASNPVCLLARPDSCTSAQFSMFEPVSLSELLVVVQHLKPSHCSLDVIPPRLLTQIWDVVGSMILSIINQSLSKGVVPSYFKHALVQPLLKKPTLDPSVKQLQTYFKTAFLG